MKRSYLFISLFIFSGFVFAQTPAARIQASDEIIGQNTNQVKLDINLLQSLKIGFSIELPTETMAAITGVKIGNENIWLKKEASIPQAANTLHWTEQDGQIILLFAPTVLSAGQNINLSLQVFQQTNPTGASELRIRRINSAEEGKYLSGAEISRVQIFQSNNIETR